MNQLVNSTLAEFVTVIQINRARPAHHNQCFNKKAKVYVFCFKISFLCWSQLEILKHAKDTQDRHLFVTLMQATTPPAHPFRIIYNIKDQKSQPSKYYKMILLRSELYFPLATTSADDPYRHLYLDKQAKQVRNFGKIHIFFKII